MSTPRRRLDALEAHTAGRAVDRYIAYVTHVDRLTEPEAHALRPVVDENGQPPESLTCDELANARAVWAQMEAWESAQGLAPLPRSQPR